MALVGDPELLFLDEPTTGFDPSARRQAWDVIAGLRDLGKTVFLTTHYMDEAQRARRPGDDHRRRRDRRPRHARRTSATARASRRRSATALARGRRRSVPLQADDVASARALAIAAHELRRSRSTRSPRGR